MIKLLSHLSYVAITSPDVEASVDFYVNQVGLTVVDRIDGAVYLRCWGDYYAYSVVVVPGDEPSLETTAWRTSSAEALEEAAKRVEAAGIQGEWVDVPHDRPRLPLHRPLGPHADPALGRHAPPRHRGRRRVDLPRPPRAPQQGRRRTAPARPRHDRDERRRRVRQAWYVDVLGFRFMARTVLDEAPISVFSVLTTNEKSHDLGVVLDGSTNAGRVNHYAFWVDTREELLIAADVLGENGYPIEYGPSIHGIGEQNFLYYREPSSLRIELNTGGYRNYVPDWEANTWKPSQGSNNFYRNSAMPMSMTESFPPADGPSATEEGVPDEIKDALLNPYAKHGQG